MIDLITEIVRDHFTPPYVVQDFVLIATDPAWSTVPVVMMTELAGAHGCCAIYRGERLASDGVVLHEVWGWDGRGGWCKRMKTTEQLSIRHDARRAASVHAQARSDNEHNSMTLKINEGRA